MYLGSWKIDDYLTFTCNTHTASTGAATDADSVPTYRVYEDETGTAILTGSTAKLDDANTTGFYSEQIQLTAANGLEKGKTYTIYMSATVGGVTGTMSHTFQMEAEVDANVVSDSSVAQASTALSNATWTDARAGYLDELGAANIPADVDAILTDTGTTLADAISTIDNNVDAVLTDTGTTIPGTITTLQTDVTAIKAKTDNLPDGIQKNQAYTAFTFFMVDSTDHVTAKTGLTVSGYYSGDGGAVTALTNSVSEISNGLYKVNLTAGELNYTTTTLIFTASGADARVITIHTST